MIRPNVYILLFIPQFTALTAIMINGKAITVSKIVEEPNFNAKKISAETGTFDDKYIISKKNIRGVKSNFTRSSTIAPSQGIIDKASNNFELRVPFLSQYIPHLTSNVKPIYEIQNQPNRDIFQDVNNSGYFYDPPIENFHSSNQGVKHVKNNQQSQDVTKSVLLLDKLLKSFLNDDSYNNPSHLPTNPILSLILSRYGKYVSGIPNSGLYSYMAVNNIHNIKPFGQYKYERDEFT